MDPVTVRGSFVLGGFERECETPDELEKAIAEGSRLSPLGEVVIRRGVNHRGQIWWSDDGVPKIEGETLGEHARRCGEGPCLRCVGREVIGPVVQDPSLPQRP